jgi:hypothetical protein
VGAGAAVVAGTAAVVVKTTSDTADSAKSKTDASNIEE